MGTAVIYYWRRPINRVAVFALKYVVQCSVLQCSAVHFSSNSAPWRTSRDAFSTNHIAVYVMHIHVSVRDYMELTLKISCNSALSCFPEFWSASLLPYFWSFDVVVVGLRMYANFCAWLLSKIEVFGNNICHQLLFRVIIGWHHRSASSSGYMQTMR